MFYVATLSRYVLVDAPDEATARRLGLAALQSESAERRTSITVRTVRRATDDEIALDRWHRNHIEREQRRWE